MAEGALESLLNQVLSLALIANEEPCHREKPRCFDCEGFDEVITGDEPGTWHVRSRVSRRRHWLCAHLHDIQRLDRRKWGEFNLGPAHPSSVRRAALRDEA